MFLATLTNTLSLGRIKAGWYSAPYVSQADAIFSGGCPRSGTTLLYSLLNSHSKMGIGIETGLLTGMRNIKGLAHRTRLPESELQCLYRQSRCFPEFTEKVLKRVADKDNKRRWGDKSPGNVMVLESMFLHFPNSRFIHIIRDGRDAVCSMRNYPPAFGNKYKLNPWPICVEKWNDWTRYGIQFRQDPRYFELRYEELVQNPETALREVVTWLGESWEPEMLALARKEKVSSHPELSNPINASRTARWRKDLPTEARELFRGPPNDLLVKLGYATDDKWIGENQTGEEQN